MPRQSRGRIAKNHEAILRAVCDSPDDDAPRLAYAERLEASGDPNDSARADLIRVQCELSRVDLNDERWEALHARQEALKEYFEDWVNELPQLEGVRWNPIDFRRGFIWEIWCDDEERFRRHATVIFAAAPIRSLSFMRLRSLKPVVEVPELSRIRRLILDDMRLGSADAQVLAESPFVEQLTALHLSGNRFGNAGAKALAASPHLRRLDNLNLGHNGIGDDGVLALANSPIAASLSHLGLAGNLLTNTGALALAASPQLSRLTGMTLWECKKIGAKGKQALRARFGDVVSFED